PRPQPRRRPARLARRLPARQGRARPRGALRPHRGARRGAAPRGDARGVQARHGEAAPDPHPPRGGREPARGRERLRARRRGPAPRGAAPDAPRGAARLRTPAQGDVDGVREPAPRGLPGDVPRAPRGASMSFAVIGLGGNLGDPVEAFGSAARMLDATPGLRVLARSKLYETAPIGPPQPHYLNAALRLELAISPRALLRRCLEIERAHGRDREKEIRFGPRTLDLDLLYVDGVVMHEDDLVVPHPRL